MSSLRNLSGFVLKFLIKL